VRRRVACTVRAGGLRKRTDGNVNTAPQADPTTARPKPGRAHALKAYGPARTPSDTRTIKRDRTNQEVSDISDESVTIAESSSL